MSERYAALIEEWRSAAARTREAQLGLKAKFDAHIAGGPAPTEEEVAHVRQLRAVEGEKLEAAMDYVRRTALGRPTTADGGVRRPPGAIAD
jgi:hypothetical protein